MQRIVSEYAVDAIAELGAAPTHRCRPGADPIAAVDRIQSG
jgi:hypothetical protein